MVERLLARNASSGVEGQHLAQQVDCKGVSIRVQSVERNPRLDGKGPDVVLSLSCDDVNDLIIDKGAQRNILEGIPLCEEYPHWAFRDSAKSGSTDRHSW